MGRPRKGLVPAAAAIVALAAFVADTPAATFATHEIQGSGSISPLVGQVVTTSGIVTARKSNGFFIQAADANADADPNTSEGILVFTSSTPPAGAAVGNNVSVDGTVTEFIPAADPSSKPETELTAPTVSVLSTGNSLPAPVTITAADTTTGDLNNLERYEGMRVQVGSLTVIGPTEGVIGEPNATATSTGVFYGVVSGVGRPFREPGINVSDPLPAGSPCCVPRFDENPERLGVDSDAQPGSGVIDVGVGAIVTGLVGPLDYAFRTYTILPDPFVPVVSGQPAPVPAPAPTAAEATVASLHLQRFYDTADDPSVGDPVLTSTAFDNRLSKASLVIRTQLHYPDVVGVEEVENLSTLQSIATRVDNDAVGAGDPNPSYGAFLFEGNDVAGLDVGFLVKTSRVSVLSVTQEGSTATYINPNTGMPDLLNDKPPLVLQAVITPGSGPTLPLTVIANHLRALTGIADPTDGNRVRAKRRAQAEFLANLIQARQSSNPTEKIVSLGDYNAYQFNDGYVDVMGTIRGQPAPANQVVLSSADLVSPDLVSLVETLPAVQRYTFESGGNAEALDHVLVTTNLAVSRFAIARFGADFPATGYGDPATPTRLSDHDAPVAYLSGGPTAVGVVSFTAARTRAGVRVHWRIAIEGQTLGFNLYRMRDGRLTKLNRTLIRQAGRSYSRLDRHAGMGALSYRLQAVNRSGARSWVGAVAVRNAR